MSAAAPASARPRTTLAGVLGTSAGAIALAILIPSVESGRTVDASIKPDGSLAVRHIAGKQYLKPYLDIVKVATACDGIANADVKAAMKAGRVYTEAQCTVMLEQQLIAHAEPVIKCIPALYGKANQAVAAVSLSFNIGPAGVCQSSIARLWNAGKWAAGCDRFPLFNKAGGRVVPGLVARRARERAICVKDLPR